MTDKDRRLAEENIKMLRCMASITDMISGCSGLKEDSFKDINSYLSKTLSDIHGLVNQTFADINDNRKIQDEIHQGKVR